MTSLDPTDPTLGLGPLDREPVAVRPPFAVRRVLIRDPHTARTDRRLALLEALGPVELGAYDLRMLNWQAGWDTPTVGSIASLIWRARAAERRAARGELQ